MVIYYKNLGGVSLEDAYAEMEEVQEIIEEVLKKFGVSFRSPYEKIPGKINIIGDFEIFGYLDERIGKFVAEIVIPKNGPIAEEIGKELKNQGYKNYSER